jgi:uncharacterized coiled-coil protein SlyX
MDSISVTNLAAIIGVVGFIYTYIKDRYDSGKAIGKLEERVTQLESKNQVLEQLIETLTETRLAVARLEQKVEVISTWVTNQQGNNNG